MMTWAQLDQHVKPILVANIGGFWDPLVALFDRMTEKGFLHKAFLGHVGHEADLPVVFVRTVAEIIPVIEARIARTPRPVLEDAGRTDLL
jgi:predicted Rossmann-fold nucleotide-binding protein